MTRTPSPVMRRTVAGLTLSAAALVGIVLHEGYTDRAVIPVLGDVPIIGFGVCAFCSSTLVRKLNASGYAGACVINPKPPVLEQATAMQ